MAGGRLPEEGETGSRRSLAAPAAHARSSPLPTHPPHRCPSPPPRPPLPPAPCRSRFQPVHVPEPSVDETYEIMLGLRERYEAHHKLRYTDEALRAAAKYSSQYISDRFLPDKVCAL